MSDISQLGLARTNYCTGCKARQDTIEAQAAEIKRLREAHSTVEAELTANERMVDVLREALHEVFEQWAGSEGFIPKTAPEGYLLGLSKRMADTARAALGETE